MGILSLDHINISGDAALLEACRRFYVDVLGLADGHRPPFRSRGFWLYAGGQPIIHLTESQDGERGPTGAFNHFAMRCEGAAELIARLRANGIEHEVTGVPESTTVQIFVRDPAGVALELNVPPAAAADASRSGDRVPRRR